MRFIPHWPVKLNRSFFAALLALSLAVPEKMVSAQGGPPPESKRVATILLGGDHSTRDLAHRTIVGQVLDRHGKPLSGAMVYLKDVKTSSLRSLLADENGTYRFGPLPLTNDYEIWAQAGSKKTSVKPISSFIATNYITVPLRFDEAPSASQSPVDTGSNGTSANPPQSPQVKPQ